MLTNIWTNVEASEWMFLIAAIVCAIVVILDLINVSRRPVGHDPTVDHSTRYIGGVNWLAVAVGLISLGLLALP